MGGFILNVHSSGLGSSEELLICGESYPLNDEPKVAYIRDYKPKRKLLHNCAGKHLGFLAYAKEKGNELSNYNAPHHPLQQEILKQLAKLSETPINQINKDMDGCGAPSYGVPFKNMAISYLKFVALELIEDEVVAQAFTEIGEVMNAHSEIVASHNFICTALLEDQNIIAKVGAQVVYCLALKKKKNALKVLSGPELV